MKKVHYVWVTIAIMAAIFILIQVFGRPSNASSIPIGSSAPNKGFYLQNGTDTNLSAYSGKEVLLYLVTTWCSTCAEGTQALGKNIAFFNLRNVSVLEIEAYKDFGYAGPTINQFVNTYAGQSSKYITAGYSGYNLTKTYDPKGYLDIYYLISPSGKVLYVNGEPSATLNQLEAAIRGA
ncbi:MAG: redoxin family protein [Candidatus Micrarchaeia archaeon]